MDLRLAAAVADLAAAVATAEHVHPVGGRTQWEVGGIPALGGLEAHAPEGVAEYDPADLTVRVRAGTRVGDLGSILGDAGQECPLDARSADATVGGVIACGLSGIRRLRYGPLRDRVLEVSFVTADGRLVRAGGPTVKNVTGFDLPRLLVGSFGTVGVIVEAVLRCQPRPGASLWTVAQGEPDELRDRAYRPSAMLWDGETTAILHEGHPRDIATEQLRLASRSVGAAPALPVGPHRGRISVRPGRIRTLGEKLSAQPGVRWLAEVGVGTVHVATDTEGELCAARASAEELGGWLLREAGATGMDAFGTAFDNPVLHTRIRDAFDPTRKLARGRLPR